MGRFFWGGGLERNAKVIILGARESTAVVAEREGASVRNEREREKTVVEEMLLKNTPERD